MYSKIKPGLLSGTLLLTLAIPLGSAGFGGEDQVDGTWHHADMTFRALAGDAKLLKLKGTGNLQSSTAKSYYKSYNKSRVQTYKTKEDAYVFAGSGFSEKAALSIAWHADYIDSYLYNPVWWGQGGLTSKRTKAAYIMFDDLAKLHHDDTFTAAGVQDNWNRYASGTLAGLYWAAQKGDVAAAHNLLGVSIHSVQDFYSHSSWMDDPKRRKSTWFDYNPSTRAQGLFTGAYEQPDSQAQAHHGAYSMSCSMINGTGLNSTLKDLCGGYSPLQNTGMCEDYRVCKEAKPVTLKVNAAGLNDILPDGVVHLQPTGIAMDNTWLTLLGADERGITNGMGEIIKGNKPADMDQAMCNAIINFHDASRDCTAESDYLFAQTKYLAAKSTMQWVGFLEKSMKEMGQESFWNQVKSGKPSTFSEKAWTRQFEDFRQLPFQFLSAGPYPVSNAKTGAESDVKPHHRNHEASSSSNGWYLRLKINTSGSTSSGTDADIYADVKAGGKTKKILLDYLPTYDAAGHTDNRLMVYNDFEQRDNDVYTVGPFSRKPTQLTLRNSAPDTGDVLEAAWDDAIDSIDEGFTDLRRGVLSIFGGNADYIDAEKHNWTVDKLTEITKGSSSNGVKRTLRVDGGSENGIYTIPYSVSRSDALLNAKEKEAGWKAFSFAFSKLHCVRESDIDGASSDDEPFFFMSLAPITGKRNQKVQSFRKSFEDVDTGEDRNFTLTIYSFKLPPKGGVVIATEMWESDSENQYDRDQAWKTFTTGVSESTRRGNGKFIDALGAATASDWKVNSVDAFAFYRGKRPKAGSVLKARNIGWIDGGNRKKFALDNSKIKTLIPENRPGVHAWNVRKKLTVADLKDANIEVVNRVPQILKNQTISNTSVKATTPTIKNIPTVNIPIWPGSWTTTFGELTLEQDGTRVFGGDPNRIKIEAQYNKSSKRLAGTFIRQGRPGNFYVNRSDQSFTGAWKWSSDPNWSGGWSGKRTVP